MFSNIVRRTETASLWLQPNNILIIVPQRPQWSDILISLVDVSAECLSHLSQSKHVLLLPALAHTCVLSCFYKSHHTAAPDMGTVMFSSHSLFSCMKREHALRKQSELHTNVVVFLAHYLNIFYISCQYDFITLDIPSRPSSDGTPSVFSLISPDVSTSHSESSRHPLWFHSIY